MSLHPAALIDGKFIVNIIIQHPADSKQDIGLQRYWSYYHDKNIPAEDYTSNIQFIRPAPESVEYAKKHNLQKVRTWIHLNHCCTFIHGPFEFSTLNGRKTSDRIDEKDWNVFISRYHLYDDNSPSFDTIKPLQILYSPFHDSFETKELKTGSKV